MPVGAGAGDAGPAGAVDGSQDVPGVDQPPEHVVPAVIGQGDRLGYVVGFAGGDVEPRGELLGCVLAVGGELEQARGEVVVARLEVDRSRQAKISPAIVCAWVGVARGGDG